MITDTLAQQLARFADLPPQEQVEVTRVSASHRYYSAGQTLAASCDPLSGTHVILKGIACRSFLLPGGGRQIVSYVLPGEFCGLRACLVDYTDHSVTALTRVESLLVSRDSLRELTSRSPQITRALWRLTLVDAAIARQWLLNIGQRSAFEGLAHLFCELFTRLGRAGLVRGNSCELALTQKDLGDALALSSVHVNRTLKVLRSRGLANLQQRRLTIHDLEALKVVATFDARYLDGAGESLVTRPRQERPLEQQPRFAAEPI